MIEPTVSVGSLVAIISTIGSGIAFVWAIKTSVRVLDARMTAQEGVIVAIRRDVEKLNEVVTHMGLAQKRMDVIEERTLAQGKRFDEHIARFDRLIDERLSREDS